MSSDNVVIEVPKEFAFSQDRVMKAYQGPISRNIQNYVATNNNLSSIQFSIQTPSRRVLVRKNIMVYYDILVTLSAVPVLLAGTVKYSIMVPGQGDAPRFMPVMSNATTIQGSIGDVTLTTNNTNLFIDAFSRYSLTAEERMKLWFSFPHQSDPCGAGLSGQMQNATGVNLTACSAGLYGSFNNKVWVDAVTGLGTTLQSLCVPSLKNPLIQGTGSVDKNGDWYYFMAPANFGSASATTQTAHFVSCEPFLGLSGFGQTSLSREAGFVNVQNMTFNITLQNNPTMWSHDISIGGIGVASTSLVTEADSFPATPQMFIEYWTPEEKLNIFSSIYYYPYSAITYFSQPKTNAIAAGATFQVVYQNVQVSSVPQEMYMFCIVSNATQQLLNTTSTITAYSVQAGGPTAMNNYAGVPSGQTIIPSGASTPGTYPIQNNIISITFDNSPAQLQSMNAQEIYAMCVENGLSGMTFADFQAFGGIYKIIFGKDVYSTNTNEVVLGGTVGSYNIQVSCYFQNNFGQSLIFNPILVTVQQGFIRVGPDGNRLEQNALSNQNLANAKVYVDNSPVQQVSVNSDLKGGSLLGTKAGGASFLENVGDFFGSLASAPLNLAGVRTDALTNIGRQIGNSANKITQRLGINRLTGGKRISKKRLRQMRNGGYSLH